jgi:hypothetical protein
MRAKQCNTMEFFQTSSTFKYIIFVIFITLSVKISYLKSRIPANHKTSNIYVCYIKIQSNLYIKATQGTYKSGLYDQLPFIYRLKLYAIFINGENDTALYRQ